MKGLWAKLKNLSVTLSACLRTVAVASYKIAHVALCVYVTTRIRISNSFDHVRTFGWSHTKTDLTIIKKRLKQPKYVPS